MNFSSGQRIEADMNGPFDWSAVAPAWEKHANVSSLAGPLAVALASASPDQVQAVRETAAELTSKFAAPDGMVLPGRALVAIAS